MDRSMNLKTQAVRALAVASLTGPLAGCAWFAPSGEPPAMPSPAHYGATPQVQQTVAAQGVTQQFEVGAKPVPDWWKQYRSDALNALGLRGQVLIGPPERQFIGSPADDEFGRRVASVLDPDGRFRHD